MFKRFLSVAYSSWMWFETFAIMFVSWVAALLVGPFLPARRLNPLLAWCMGNCLRLSFCRLRVVVDEGFDPSRPSVFCMNHTGIMDAHLASWAIPQPFTGLMLAWHFKIPGYGWIMKLTRGIPVHPGSGGRFGEVAAVARKRVAMGLGILTFPEAHRTLDGKVRPFRRGMFFMARDAGIPVVPLAAHGMYAFNHKGTRLFRRGTITVYIGPQIETAGLSDDQVGALSERVHGIVSSFAESQALPAALDQPPGRRLGSAEG